MALPHVLVAWIATSLALASGLARSGGSEPRSAPQAREPAAKAEPGSREERRLELAREVAKSPGWSLDETTHYFVLTSAVDPKLVEAVKSRVEAIRREIARDFPHPELDPAPVRTAPSTIRLLRDRVEFAAHGGPAGAAGYWNDRRREIVVFDGKASEGRDDTFASLQGTVFLEYVATLAEATGAAPWFVYGHSDYYSGFAERDGLLLPRAFSWRERLAQDNIRANRIAPLPVLVQLSPAEYVRGKYQAQAWSFVWFLRQGSSRPPLWLPEWDGILDTWWAEWRETRDSRAANEKAFAGVDWVALESAWKRFTLGD
jgi:hypothetical protein